MKNSFQTLATLTLSAALAAPALATGSHADHDHSTPEGMAQHMQMMQDMPGMTATAQSASDQPQTEGVVRKIDLAAGKITLRHGAIPGMGMGAMTMVYAVKDKAMLDGLKAGDKVRFAAEKVDGSYIVTRIEKAE